MLPLPKRKLALAEKRRTGQFTDTWITCANYSSQKCVLLLESPSRCFSGDRRSAEARRRRAECAQLEPAIGESLRGTEAPETQLLSMPVSQASGRPPGWCGGRRPQYGYHRPYVPWTLGSGARSEMTGNVDLVGAMPWHSMVGMSPGMLLKSACSPPRGAQVSARAALTLRDAPSSRARRACTRSGDPPGAGFLPTAHISHALLHREARSRQRPRGRSRG